MEGKQRLLQLLAFTNGPAIDVVQQYFELKIIRQGSDFEDYLNDPQNKHRLFHERYPKIPCCECIRTTSIAAPAKRGCLGYQQFSKLYDENGNVTAGHEQTNRSQISQHCICKVSAQKSIKVIDIDLTLLNAIIQHCCNLHITTKIAPWMKVIKEVRDTISHLSEGKLEKNLFEQTWKKLKNATLQCAGDIGHTSVKIFQMTIDLITTCSVDDLEKRMLQTTNKLSEVHKDLNGIIPAVQSILSKQNELCDQLCSNSKDLIEVKTLCSGVNTVMVSASVNQERTNDEMEKLNVKTEKIEEDVGDIKHMLQQIKFMCAMKIKPPGENLEEYGKGEKNRKLTLDVDVTSAAWDEKRTTCKLEDEMQATKKRVDNVQHDDNTTFVIEKVENKCIYLELSASPEVFQSPQRLRTAIKSLIRQFVQAGELDENVPATVNINIIVNSALTTEEKTVVYTVFSDNDTLDGSDDDVKLQFEQKPRFIVKEPTIEPDQQIASTSAKNSSPEETESAVFNEYLAINKSNDSSGPSSFAEYLERFNEILVVDEVVENSSPEETESAESAVFNEYLAINRSNDPSGPSSFAEYLEPFNEISVVDEVVDEDVNIHRFFLELTATCGLSWIVFLADLGYNSKELLKLPGNLRDIFFFQYLLHWLETVTRLGFNPIKFMYRALIKTQDKDLINKFKRQIQSDTLELPSDHEYEIIKGNLFEIDISNQNKNASCIKDRKEQIMYVERDIWSNLTPDELAEIKAFLGQTKKEKFPKQIREKIKTGVDLMQKLHETCLITEDDVSYLKSILHFLKRDDLIVKITELESPGFVFQKETLPVKRNVSSCISTDHDLPTSNHKPLEDLELSFFHSTRIIKNTISAANKNIWQTDCRVKDLTNTSESYRQEMQNCAEKRMQVEAQIKKLQSDANDLQSKEASLKSKLSSLDAELKEVKKLHQKLIDELDIYKNTLEKEIEIQEELKKKQMLEEEKKSQLLAQKQKQREDENRRQLQQKEELENRNRICQGKDIRRYSHVAKTMSRYESHISRDGEDMHTEEKMEPMQVDPPGASSEEAIARPLSPEVSVEPMILIMAAEENKSDLKSFKSDVLQEAPRSVTLNKVHEIIIERNTTEEFLNRTDEEMPKAVLLFILVSDVFAKRCCPAIFTMKNLTAALYGAQPLVVPVIIKANVKPPMSLNSAHSLRFYTRDSYYKDALRKLLGQLN